MTSTDKIPVKKLLLHISHVINACDLSSVTSSKLKKYLQHRFKDALPSEKDLDIILENMVSSFKLSQALNSCSLPLRESNRGGLNLKDNLVENEVLDEVCRDKPVKKIRKFKECFLKQGQPEQGIAYKAFSYISRGPSREVRIIKPTDKEGKNKSKGAAKAKTSEAVSLKMYKKERVRSNSKKITETSQKKRKRESSVHSAKKLKTLLSNNFNENTKTVLPKTSKKKTAQKEKPKSMGAGKAKQNFETDVQISFDEAEPLSTSTYKYSKTVPSNTSNENSQTFPISKSKKRTKKEQKRKPKSRGAGKAELKIETDVQISFDKAEALSTSIYEYSKTVTSNTSVENTKTVQKAKRKSKGAGKAKQNFETDVQISFDEAEPLSTSTYENSKTVPSNTSIENLQTFPTSKFKKRTKKAQKMKPKSRGAGKDEQRIETDVQISFYEAEPLSTSYENSQTVTSNIENTKTVQKTKRVAKKPQTAEEHNVLQPTTRVGIKNALKKMFQNVEKNGKIIDGVNDEQINHVANTSDDFMQACERCSCLLRLID